MRRIPRLGSCAHDSGDCGVLKVCTVHVGSLKGRSREVVEMLSRREVYKCCLQEVWYRGAGATSIGTKEEKYKLWYSGEEGGENGVGIFIKYELAKDVIEVERFGERMMVKMVIGKTLYHIFSVYAPQVGRSEDEKVEFWEGLEDKVVGVPRSEELIVAGDLNSHIGSNRDGYEDVMGHFSFGGQNTEGGTVLDLCRNHKLQILNTYFKKDREK